MIQNLRLQHFRTYQDESFEFGPGVNIIVGPNASGKTNLLEALQVACLGASYRARDVELVAFGADWARLDAQDDATKRVVKLQKQGEAVLKTFEIHDKKLRRLGLRDAVPLVLFEPNHLLLLHGGPERRRDYLDDLLEQLVPEFGPARRHYKRTLGQRNALLKRGSDPAGQLFAWNIRLSDLGGFIATQRKGLLTRLNEQLSSFYSRLAGQAHTVGLRYVSSVEATDYSSQLLKKLEAHQQLDFERGFTAYGPHRDDFTLELDAHLANETASRGEVRTLLLALKLIEMTILEQERDQAPLLLLDDVFSELDGTRRRALTEVLATHQTFITTTDADLVVQHFTDTCQIIPTTRKQSRRKADT